MPAMANPTRKGEHKIRENIDALAIAILMAVLMKYFAIEAYQIPTSSMQPTMMGSKEASVYDRIIVDKSSFLWRDPQRWEIAVFRYPIRLVQNYVKRIVGIGGDRLHIAGGNVYQVAQGKMPGDPGALQALHRPAAVAENHWREIFPARIEVWDPGRYRVVTYLMRQDVDGMSGSDLEPRGAPGEVPQRVVRDPEPEHPHESEAPEHPHLDDPEHREVHGTESGRAN